MKTIKNENKNILESKIKDFIYNELKRKIRFIKKQRRHTKNFDQKLFEFLI